MLPAAEVPALRPDADVTSVLPELGTDLGRALVVDGDGRLAGLLSVTDVMRALEAAPRSRA
jgi:CBS-domain-containing membrane protein